MHSSLISSYRLKALLSEIYDTSENPGKIIIFVETKRRVDHLVRFIRSFGVRCGAIHGDKSQSERDFVLREFRSGKSNILVATDVAARGLGKLFLNFRQIFRYKKNNPCIFTYYIIIINIFVFISITIPFSSLNFPPKKKAERSSLMELILNAK